LAKSCKKKISCSIFWKDIFTHLLTLAYGTREFFKKNPKKMYLKTYTKSNFAKSCCNNMKNKTFISMLDQIIVGFFKEKSENIRLLIILIGKKNKTEN
jgi:hypothetical protein